MTIIEVLYQLDDVLSTEFNKQEAELVKCFNALIFLAHVKYEDIAGLKDKEVKALGKLNSFCLDNIKAYVTDVTDHISNIIRKYEEDNNLENKTKEELIEIIKNYQK